MTSYSDHIVFVDESGDHSLESINTDYPVFVLSFCIINKTIYAESLAPAVKKLKFEFFGHDAVILHERDIRKKDGAFAKFGKEARESFLESLTSIIAATEFTLIAIVIDKEKHKRRYVAPDHPYHLAMGFGLERLYRLMKSRGQETRVTHVLCEARGKIEDRQLELEFRRICDGRNYFNGAMPFEIIMTDKKANCEGLQIADLMARPIGMSVLRPDQPNRAMEALQEKFYRNEKGEKNGFGLKIFP